MSDCKDLDYYKCDPVSKVTTDVSNNSTSTTNHDVEHELKLDLGFIDLYSIKTKRTFSISNNNTTSKDVHHVTPTSCEGLATPPCYSWCIDTDTSYSASVSENCVITKDTIYYLDLVNQVVFFKREHEELIFSSSSDQATPMRQKFGTTYHNVLKIKGAAISGKEQHILIYGGEERILDEVIYTRSPEWFMGPIGLPNAESGVTMPTGCEAYDHDIQQILLYGTVPSKALPMDMEIRCLGFYDYGGDSPIDQGELLRPDGGGKDYFYPLWCRSMISDPYWADVAERRYMMTWEHDTPAGGQVLQQPTINFDPVPKGNCVYHEVLGKMYNFTFQNRNGQALSIVDLNGKDPSQAIINMGVSNYGPDWAYHPIGVL